MKYKSARDFFYDKNDIILAVIILLIAALLIWWRMTVIMNYPQTLAQATNTTDTTSQQAVDNNSTKSIYADNKLTRDVTVIVDGGSASGAAQCLIDIGLFKSYDEFASVCKSASCNAEDIKADTFTFAAGSTKEDIVKKVTK